MVDVVLMRPWLSTGPQLIDENGVTLLTFDASLSEQHQEGVEVTQHPVESGIDITDHSYELPDTVTMTVVLTDSPTDPLDEEADRARGLYNTLHKILYDREPVDLITGLSVYTDMLLRRISVVRTSASGMAIEVDVEFVEVRFADQVDVLIPERILKESVKDKGRYGGVRWLYFGRTV